MGLLAFLHYLSFSIIAVHPALLVRAASREPCVELGHRPCIDLKNPFGLRNQTSVEFFSVRAIASGVIRGIIWLSPGPGRPHGRFTSAECV